MYSFSEISLSDCAMSAPPLTDQEQMELERLMKKAAKAKSFASPSLPQGPPCYDAANGVIYDPTTGAAYDVWGEEHFHDASIAAMTDASKRRDDDHPEMLVTNKRVNMATGAPVPGGYVEEIPDVPYMHGPGHIQQLLPKTGLPPLPEGISDVDLWGKTMIKFGCFKDSGMSYADLASSSGEREVGYVKWCRSRNKCAQGHLRDFCNYLSHYFQDVATSSNLVIPGTSDKRVFKP